MSDQITIEKLTKKFHTSTEDITLFENIDLVVDKEESLILTGESGSGKSTFLNIISGLDKPNDGHIYFGETQIDTMNEEQLSDFRLMNIGLVFQFHHLLKDFTALENAAIPGILRGLSKTEAMTRAEDLVSLVGLSNRKDHYPSKLSGGEKQRIAIARALFNEPQVILADEPTGNLDEKNSRMVEEIFFDLLKSQQKTLMLVTHDLRLIEYGTRHIQIKDRQFIG
ncbi:ABC transporter ATP-binding protein [Spirochaeta cellobiosiphila]|uniref:ABC transporter ATP-binding protein n=1 Tax=Spirochaeta cellobiosiphila TaxID=504483 RepID=UPI000419406B|nr:ABC transporter ATP-binding protein [Spirochaeta cellobiosiphila]